MSILFYVVAELTKQMLPEGSSGRNPLCCDPHFLCSRDARLPELVLERGRGRGLRSPQGPAARLDHLGAGQRRDRAPRRPQLHVRHLHLPVAPPEEGQSRVWSHGWEPVDFPAR